MTSDHSLNYSTSGCSGACSLLLGLAGWREYLKRLEEIRIDLHFDSDNLWPVGSN